MENQPRESLVKENRDPLIRFLNKIVVMSVKLLAILMVIVILWSLVDVVAHLVSLLVGSESARLNADNLIAMLGSFLAVLIAIEIFLNIVFYLKQDAIHVPLVLATALTAVARKVIILDYSTTTPLHILGVASVISAVGIVYWLLIKDRSLK